MPNITKPTGLNKIWATEGVATPPSDSKIQQGWNVEAPPYQIQNYINQKHDQFDAHVNQHGLPVWDSETEYQGGFGWTMGSNGSLYFCKVTNTNNNPVTDLSETYWRKVLDGANVLPSASVSTFALTLLDDTSASQMRSTLGGTTVGQNLFTASSTSAARGFLGATSIGSTIFTAANPSVVLTALGIGNATTDTPGFTEIATQSEVNAGADGFRSVTPQTMRFGFSISLSGTGHIKFPTWLSGLEIRWGTLSAEENQTVSTGNIFTTACLAAVGNIRPGGEANTSSNSPMVYPSGRAVALRNLDSSDEMNFGYIAIGY